MDKKTWKEFKDCGLLWWINMILHTFGWAIVLEIEEDGSVSNAYPARVQWRGFPTEANNDGYLKVSAFLDKNAAELNRETQG